MLTAEQPEPALQAELVFPAVFFTEVAPNVARAKLLRWLRCEGESCGGELRIAAGFGLTLKTLRTDSNSEGRGRKANKQVSRRANSFPICRQKRSRTDPWRVEVDACGSLALTGHGHATEEKLCSERTREVV